MDAHDQCSALLLPTISGNAMSLSFKDPDQVEIVVATAW